MLLQMSDMSTEKHHLLLSGDQSESYSSSKPRNLWSILLIKQKKRYGAKVIEFIHDLGFEECDTSTVVDILKVALEKAQTAEKKEMKLLEIMYDDNDLATRLVGEDISLPAVIVGLGFDGQGDELAVGASDDDNSDFYYDSNGESDASEEDYICR